MSKKVLLALALMGLAACSSGNKEEQQASRMLGDARFALRHGHYDEARDSILSMRRQHPTALQARRQAILLLDSIEMLAATDSLTELWVGGFLASQATLGLLLFPIVVITLVFPSTIKLMLSLALALYILARIVFIWKGFRIFFNNLSSSIYFILYLCAVEIVPPLLALAGTVYVCSIL